MKHGFRMAQWGTAAAVMLLFGTGAAWAAADHYLCYTGAYAKGETKLAAPFLSYELKDQVEDLFYDAKKPIWECNPATKIHNGQTYDISHPAFHLEGYQIALTKLPVKQVELKNRLALVRDQFGELPLKITVPESVNVRTSKTLLAEPPVACSATKPCTAPATCSPTAGVCVSAPGYPTAPVTHDIDNYKCYKVAMQPGIKFTPIVGAVQAQDEFGGKCTAGNPAKTGTFCANAAACDGPTPTVGNGVCGPLGYDIVKPTRLCMPVDKNHEDPGAELNPDHLMCYQIKLSATNKLKFPKALVANANENFPPDRLNVTALKELCVPATKQLYYCGDGVVSQPFEDCDPMEKVCLGGPTPGAPCTGNTTCAPGTCVPNLLACPNPAGVPNTVACGKTCQCPMVPIANQDYRVSDFSMNINAATSLGHLVFALSSSDAGGGGTTTLKMDVSPPDLSGRSKFLMAKDSWVFDSISIPPSTSLPLTISVRLCPDTDLTGTLFTSTAAFPTLSCVAGNPALLLTSCLNSATCDGPTPIVGNGVCATLDVDYTSISSGTTPANATTVYVQGDSKKDKPGSALAGVELRADVWLGDVTCVGIGGPDPGGDYFDCVMCNDSLNSVDAPYAPVGRIGVQYQSGATPANITIPLPLRLSSGNVENMISQPGNPLNGSEIKGHGYLVTGRDFRLGAANAKLRIPAPSPLTGFIDAQFFATEVFSPKP